MLAAYVRDGGGFLVLLLFLCISDVFYNKNLEEEMRRKERKEKKEDPSLFSQIWIQILALPLTSVRLKILFVISFLNSDGTKSSACLLAWVVRIK